MNRNHALALCLLLGATAVQAVAPSRASANGSGQCPEAEARAVAEDVESGPVAASPADVPATAAGSTPVPAKRGAVTRPRAARWHSFVPGMFK
ncbi:MAG: hypothetical protein LKM32_02710 [Chiayiivirga sp.]|jgi:hypothetical protein|uniref:hypothetical protein n=1 Tax=Chiayiivirga sp. TaxID=2041042 RepID=UPI0025BF4A8C|nr:hypothetical protein [Chiayiivirga sp.]MCI1710813.1 hypothetical protein [Chiayiivirga sp.]MCI1728347.1 hypothetical protein [Chiayiivirga sp.]